MGFYLNKINLTINFCACVQEKPRKMSIISMRGSRCLLSHGQLSKVLMTSDRRLLSTNKQEELDAKTRQIYDRIIRVDHAGEFGADRIYAGQLSVLEKTDVGPLIQHMWDQEKAHLAKFEELIGEYRVRPTVLHPFWKVAGYALGAGTAMLGKEAAMACTVAVEESITKHYNDQLRELLALYEESGDEKHNELMKIIAKFRDEEMEHHDTGLEHDAEKAPGFMFLKGSIQVGCKAAIWLSERV